MLCDRLLGREREFKNSVVRVHAVKTLERSSDDELIDYLLQLVQALRYEPDSSLSGSSVGEDGMLPGQGGSKTGEVVSPLATFLVVSRSCDAVSLPFLSCVFSLTTCMHLCMYNLVWFFFWLLLLLTIYDIYSIV